MTCIVKGILQQKTFDITWKVERFFADCPRIKDHYDSPEFPIQYANTCTKWRLSVYPKNDEEKNKDYVGLYLWFNCEKKIELTVNFHCSILDKVNGVVMKKELTHTYNKHEGFGWEQFIEQKVVKDTKNKILIDDTLTILCEITFQDVTKNVQGYAQWIDKIPNGLSDYEQLLEKGKHADVTFNVQDKKIDAHKAILSCRNPVFAAMFEHDMKEKTQNTVDITDVDYAVMMELLRFIYSGKVKNIEEIASDLLIAADKYEVIELKALCEKTIYEMLTVDNAIEYLKLTDMCDTIQLKALVTEFVADHYKEVVMKPEFKDLNKDVMYKIMLAIAKKDS